MKRSRWKKIVEADLEAHEKLGLKPTPQLVREAKDARSGTRRRKKQRRRDGAGSDAKT